MNLIVLSERFERGVWADYEHSCDNKELAAIVDSALAKAADRGDACTPLYYDFLLGAECVFNMAYGSEYAPMEGDTRVYAAVLNKILIGDYERIEQYLCSKANSRQSLCLLSEPARSSRDSD